MKHSITGVFIPVYYNGINTVMVDSFLYSSEREVNRDMGRLVAQYNSDHDLDGDDLVNESDIEIMSLDEYLEVLHDKID